MQQYPDIDPLFERVRLLSGSFGTPPYTLVAYPISHLKEQFEESLPDVDLRQFTYVAAVVAINDYNKDDLYDFYWHSSELNEFNEKERNDIIIDLITQHDDPRYMSAWTEKQIAVAIGILIGSANLRNYKVCFLEEHYHPGLEKMFPALKSFVYYDAVLLKK